MTFAASLIRTAAGIVCAIIVVAILLTLLGANPSNDVVGWIHDAGAWLVGPFKGLFSIKNDDLQMVVNWGLAALVYALAAGLLVRLIAGADGHGRFGRPTVA